MSLLMFHSGNVPFTLNEDMVVRDLKVASTDLNGFEFQSTEVETQQLAQDIIDGKVDAVRVIFDNKALQNSGEMDKYGYIYTHRFILTLEILTGWYLEWLCLLYLIKTETKSCNR